MAVPSIAFGMRAMARRSRMLAKSRSARPKPTPVLNPNTVEEMSPRDASAFSSAAPSTAQLVVMSGR